MKAQDFADKLIQELHDIGKSARSNTLTKRMAHAQISLFSPEDQTFFDSFIEKQGVNALAALLKVE